MRESFVDWWIAHPSLFGLPFHFWTVYVGLVGAFIGSFLNVCIHRMPLDQSIVRPPSHCPHCKYRIPLLLNIPVVTWLWLRGRCANCRAPISPRYLGVEILTSIAFVAAWLKFGEATPGVAFALCGLFSAFIVATFIDFAHFIIPDEITLGGAVAGFLISFGVPELHGTTKITDALTSSGLGIAIGYGVVWGIVQLGKLLFGKEDLKLAPGTRVVFHEEGIDLQDQRYLFGDVLFRESDTIRMKARHVELSDRCYVEAEVALNQHELSVGPDRFKPEDEPYLAADADQLILPREAMGFGDVKFMAAIGAFLGWRSTLFTLGAASMVGAAVGITLIVIGRREWSSRLPFGPYLTLGAVIWIFGGSAWWARVFGL
jgi:leader peptidase (prepilin peptidase)/N-methyltransferase